MRLVVISLLIGFASSAVSAQTETVDSLSYAKALHEVVVKATKPLTKFEGDGIVTSIQGTPLQNIGTASDILGYIPGVISNNGAIEVIGKGRPVIYINGRKLMNYSELSQIPSAKVKDIKVISSPGAQYDSSTNAVIRISTVREIGDGISLDTRATMGVRHYVYGNGQLTLNYRNRGLDVFSYIEYDYNRTKGDSRMSQNLFGVNRYASDIKINAHKRSQLFCGKIGFNYITTSGHTFGLFYQNTYKPDRSHSTSNSVTFINEAIENRYDVYSQNKDNNYEHLIDGYYSGKWGKWTADFTFDFLWRKAKDRQLVDETVTGISPTNMSLSDHSNGQMFAGKLSLSRPLLAGSIDVGTEYTNTDRKDDFVSDASALSSNNNQSKESNIGVYAQLTQRFGIVMLQAGIRYEHIESQYFEAGNKIPEQSKVYNEILPSAALVIPVKNTSFQLSYSRKYSRPLYAQLSSTVYYLNQNNYETGNPNLTSSFTDNISLNFKYRWLTVMASYKHVKNRIITTCTEYDGNPNVTLFKKENSKNGIDNLELIISAMPGFVGKFYYPVVMAGVIAQLYDIDYRGQTMSMNNPMALVRINNIFRLPKNFMIYANLSYRSDFDSENIHMHQSWQFDISAAKIFNQHWDLKLSINDVFNTARKNRFTLYSGMMRADNIRYNTVRGAELTIGYKFNTSKSKYKGTGAGQFDKERL